VQVLWTIPRLNGGTLQRVEVETATVTGTRRMLATYSAWTQVYSGTATSVNVSVRGCVPFGCLCLLGDGLSRVPLCMMYDAWSRCSSPLQVLSNTVYAVRARTVNSVGFGSFSEPTVIRSSVLMCNPGNVASADLLSCVSCPNGFVSPGGPHTEARRLPSPLLSSPSLCSALLCCCVRFVFVG
jgi:hypothetical protein